ncbi:MAG: hypothetical protein CMJ46_03200 [Planctomyces sp.]|nr:hypothetical protein [Planctomyces sp.]
MSIMKDLMFLVVLCVLGYCVSAVQSESHSGDDTLKTELQKHEQKVKVLEGRLRDSTNAAGIVIGTLLPEVEQLIERVDNIQSCQCGACGKQEATKPPPVE